MKLAELEELIAKASPAPWKPNFGKVCDEWEWAAFGPSTAGPAGVYLNQLKQIDKDFHAQLENDALLIATLRNLAPEFMALVSAVEFGRGPDTPAAEGLWEQRVEWSNRLSSALEALKAKVATIEP
jgi:hypothetical protein